eukprot:scaffold1769_cov164-Ochromonas_danica.AAC.3
MMTPTADGSSCCIVVAECQHRAARARHHQLWEVKDKHKHTLFHLIPWNGGGWIWCFWLDSLVTSDITSPFQQHCKPSRIIQDNKWLVIIVKEVDTYYTAICLHRSKLIQPYTHITSHIALVIAGSVLAEDEITSLTNLRSISSINSILQGNTHEKGLNVSSSSQCL